VCHGFRLTKQDDYFWTNFEGGRQILESQKPPNSRNTNRQIEEPLSESSRNWKWQSPCYSGKLCHFRLDYFTDMPISYFFPLKHGLCHFWLFAGLVFRGFVCYPKLIWNNMALNYNWNQYFTPSTTKLCCHLQQVIWRM